jgi:hypothetical protein
MPKRRQLGSSFTEYPAIVANRWTGGLLFKTMMCALISAIWCGIFYVFLGIYNFLNINILKKPETNVNDLFKNEMSFIIMSVGIFLITIYVFTSSRRKEEK